MATKVANEIKPEDLEVYIDLMTDTGFKKIFDNKEVMLNFLNSVLDIKGGIADLQYGNPERPEYIKPEELIGIYELFCITGNGEHIIVEVQPIPQICYRTRIASYTNDLIWERLIMQKYQNYHLYSINILDFSMNNGQEKQDYITHRQFVDSENKLSAVGNMSFVYIELPHFIKELHELKGLLEQWIFVFKNLHKLNNLPEELRNEFFEALFEAAKIEHLSSDELNNYMKEL